MAFGFGGGGGFNIGGAFGGLSLLGSAFLDFQAQREQAAVAKERERQLRMEQEAAEIRNAREERRLAQEERGQLGTIRARLAGQGVDLNSGTGRHLLNLTRQRFQQDEDDQEEMRRLESRGFTSAMGAARRARGTAGMNQFLSPAISLLGGIGGRF
jgi:hypothetical protein